MDPPALLAFLSNPASYPIPTTQVRLEETHISWVFLTDTEVYKLKKPVRFDFLDYSTLELREKACQREVRLNRRLAADVYLDVVPIGAGPHGLTFHPPGEALEYAVHMRRLPGERMLDQLVRDRKASRKDIERVLDVLLPFYDWCKEEDKGSRHAGPEGWLKNVRANIKALRAIADDDSRHAAGLAPEQVHRIEAAHVQFLRLWPERIQRRIDAGYVRDGHGDLRAEHICMTDPPAIFDCIEFNDRLRHNDVADELAFLAMDLEFHGSRELGQALYESYVRRTGDQPGRPLWSFYKSYRACVRAKVATLTSDNQPGGRGVGGEGVERGQALLQTAGRYLQLANFYALEFYKPRLVVVCGIMGTGKSTLATALAKELGFQLLQSDAIRKELLGEGNGSSPGQGAYAPGTDERVYEEMIERGATLLGHGASVLLDATFKKRAFRDAARGLARRAGVDILFVRCLCPPAVAIARLDRRARSGRSLSDGRPELYEEQARLFEPPDELAVGQLLSLDTQGGVPELVDSVIRILALPEAETTVWKHRDLDPALPLQ